MPEPLAFSPVELHLTAGKIEGHASDFASVHRAAHWRAGQVVVGSGLAGAALPEMLGAWEADGAYFGECFTRQADGHRVAANAYVHADDAGADRIADAGTAL